MDAPAGKMQMEQGTRDGRLTGYSHAWCSCGGFDMRGPAVKVASGMLSHRCSKELPDTPADPESNLVSHARRELERRGVDPSAIAWYLSVLRGFAASGAIMATAVERLRHEWANTAARADAAPVHRSAPALNLSGATPESPG
jgi:hypothetical protein